MSTLTLTPSAPTEAAAFALPPDEAWERLWFSLLEPPARPGAAGAPEWRALALVPAQPGDAALEVAHALARAARPYRGQGVSVLNATSVSASAVAGTLQALRERTASGTRVLIAADSPLTRPAVIPLARGADAAVLCVDLGRAGLADARQTLDAVGAARFLGAVTLAP